jgi:glyoxylase-like metal-dependent hydrolase (beta-lactamase superfamily II)/rhodanese-related sulfurtransferase
MVDIALSAPPHEPVAGVAATQVEIEAVAFDAEGLGDRSYLVHDGDIAVVIDPQREPERYIAAAKGLGVTITHVLETHVHNDYVSGGLGLARQLGAVYVLPDGEDLAFADECLTLRDGGEITVGALRVSALGTPGHTPHHLSYLFRSDTGEASYVCTGGSVLPGAVGRTDLLGPERADELAAAQWHSVRRLLAELDASTEVLPTHGFGSFCSAAPQVGTAAGTLTVGLERQQNPAVLAALEDFVRSLGEARPPIPDYYRFMGAINRHGGSVPSYGPTARLSPSDLDRWLTEGGVVADLRPRRSFAAGHRRGALNIELGDNLTTYFGWVVPFEAPYALIACSHEEVLRSRHLLARIGREVVAGYALASDLDLKHGERYPVATFRDLAATVRSGAEPLVLDVRHRSEWRAGHLSIARHVPLPDLGDEKSSLPVGQPIWVHCAAGFRAAIAASFLSAWGMRPVLIDDFFDQAALHGLDRAPASI